MTLLHSSRPSAVMNMRTTGFYGWSEGNVIVGLVSTVSRPFSDPRSVGRICGLLFLFEGTRAAPGTLRLM